MDYVDLGGTQQPPPHRCRRHHPHPPPHHHHHHHYFSHISPHCPRHSYLLQQKNHSQSFPFFNSRSSPQITESFAFVPSQTHWNLEVAESNETHNNSLCGFRDGAIAWRAHAAARAGSGGKSYGVTDLQTVTPTGSEVEYICQWLVVATGENAEQVVSEIEGLQNFGGEVIHACDYKSGENFRGKRVVVVGCGNSGMELSLDLCNHDAKPSMVVRSSDDTGRDQETGARRG